MTDKYQVVPDETKILGQGEAMVCLESEDYDGLSSSEAADLALRVGDGMGFKGANIGTCQGPYPVIGDGTPIANADDLAKFGKETTKRKPRWRYDYQLLRRQF